MQFGRYTLIKKIATGGMAEIWLASQRGLAGFTRFVVIKKILGHLSEQESFVKMFLDEARTCSQLTHPNIVQIYDLGKEGGAYFIAMEYIAGENLAAVAWRGIKRQMPLSPQLAAKMICDAAKALHYAHAMRGPNGRPLEIVHRDISPQNILCTYEGEVKVVDFGIAKAASKSEHTKTGMLKGKFSYMSPEQCLGSPLDGRSDVFALGIVLYELCTQKRLFKHESELMILDMITKRDVVPPSASGIAIPPGLERIMMRALEKPLERRYQTAQEMQIDLETYLKGEPRIISSTDVAAYMRALFEDRIEEKRRLCEAATKAGVSEAEGLDPGLDDAAPATPGASPDDARHGLAQSLPQVGLPAALPAARAATATRVPSMMRSRAGDFARLPAGPSNLASTQYAHVPPPGGASMPGATPMPMPMPMVGATAYVGYTGVLQKPRRSWLTSSIILIAALVIMLVAVAFDRMSEPVPVTVTRGRISITSHPEGASVFLDGRPVLDAKGVALITPVDIDNLEYGSSHQIRIEKKEHKASERAFVMGEALDKKAIAFQLEPILGTLIATVVGEDADRVEVYFGSERAGIGPTIRSERAPGKVVVSGRMLGRICVAKPEEAVVGPGATEVVSIACKRVGRAPAASGSPVQVAKSESSAKARETGPAEGGGGSGCVSNPDAIPGYATINSTPYSDVYVNGKLIGQTPIPKKQLPAGCVIIRAVNPESKKERTLRLDITPGTVQTFDFEL